MGPALAGNCGVSLSPRTARAGSAKPVKPPPCLHQPLVSSLFVVSAPAPSKAISSPDMFREFFPEFAGPWEAQAASAPMCRAPHASPASPTSALL